MKFRDFPMRELHVLCPFIRIEGVVEHGFGRGSKSLGYPTANLNSVSSSSVFSFLQSPTCKDGIYIGWVKLPTTKEPFKAAISVGLNPTFSDSKTRLIEAYLMNYTGADFYGQHVRILICGYIRTSIKFDSVDSLRSEIARDVAFSLECFQKEVRLLDAMHDVFLLE